MKRISKMAMAGAASVLSIPHPLLAWAPATTYRHIVSHLSSSPPPSSFLSASSSSPTATPAVTTTAQTASNSPRVIRDRVFATDDRPVILFDGVCNMCNNAVNLALDWDPQAKLRFSALQSQVGRALLEANGRRSNDISSIVLVTKEGGAYIKSDAVLKIAETLTPPILLLPVQPVAVLGRLLIPKVLRDVIYDGVADNRYSVMGKRDECRLDDDGAFAARFVDDSLADNDP